MIRTLLVSCYYALAVLLVLPFLILWSVITGKPDLMYGLSMKAVRLGNRIAGIRVRTFGLENIPPGPCVFAANHASNVDPLALFPAIPRRVGILVKRELFRVPILATGMRRAQFIPVERSGREAIEVGDAAMRCLKGGLPLAIFVEGTRSPDGRLRPFKKGAFAIAIQAGAPIVPVSIAGAQHLMRKGERILRPGEVTIRFGPAVDASQYTMERRSELLVRVESLVAAGLPADQQPLLAAPGDAPASSE